MSDTEDSETHTHSDVAEASDVASNTTTEVRAIIDSITGTMHGVAKSNKGDYSAARRETNAGLRKATSVAASMRTRAAARRSRTSIGSSSKISNGGPSSSSRQEHARKGLKSGEKAFTLQALVLIPGGTGMDDNDDLILNESRSPPIGQVQALESMGLAARNVEIFRSWTYDDVKATFERVLPRYFAYEETRGPRSDGLQPWVLCYRDRQRLVVSLKLEPTGGDLYELKSRPGRGKMDSFIFLAAREAIPPEVLKLWKPSASATTVKPADAPESDSDDPPSPRTIVANAMAKGKKREVVVISDDSEGEAFKAAKSRTKKGKFVRERDSNLASKSSTGTSSTVTPTRRGHISSKPSLETLTWTDVGASGSKPVSTPLFTPGSSPAPFSPTGSTHRMSSPSPIWQAPASEPSVSTTPRRKASTSVLSTPYTPSSYEPPSDMENPWEGNKPIFKF